MTLKAKAFGHCALAALVGILTFAVSSLTVRAAGWQSPDSIREAARAMALQNGATNVEAMAIDERLKLPECGDALKTEMQRVIQRGTGTVTVSCLGPTPWRLFVPVRVTEQLPVVVLRRSVQPGEVLAADDLELRQQAAAALPYDYVGKTDLAVGQTVRRSQPAGAVLLASALEQPPGVERGALVTLIAANSTVQVKAEGVALEPGRLKERVRVRSASGRVVQGVVEAPGQVRVGF
ncbi:MAG: flagellar basal body P-ring formation chaperone FlgA [Gammaproteobacteria bacterium]